MSSGILRSWYLSKLKNAKCPIEYFWALHDVFVYERRVFRHNTKMLFNI